VSQYEGIQVHIIVEEDEYSTTKADREKELLPGIKSLFENS